MRITFKVLAGPLAGQAFPFDRHDVFLVGRSPNAHCRLPEDDPYFSRVHFLIEVNPPRCRLTDLGSRNGTFVNGRQVEVVDLQHADEIKAGHTVMRVEFQRTADDPAPPPVVAVPGVTKADIHLPTVPVGSSLIASISPGLSISDLVIPDPPAGSGPPTVSGYELVGEIGRGNMGVVYRAVRQADGLDVALKVILPDEADNPVSTRRFLREAEVLGQLDHPNVVKFLESGQSGRLLYFAMEYVRGTDVGRVMKERPRFEPKTGVRLAIQVLDALAHAHARGMVHRDIKPANVLLAELPDGRRQVKLADFGLARVYRASALSGLTLYGDLGGTPAYMPPEQITNYREVMPAADQYSTAAMLYHMLTGQFILDLPPMPAGLMAIMTKTPVPLRERRPDLAEGLEPVIHKALAKDPKDRYPDVVAFRQALVPFGK